MAPTAEASQAQIERILQSKTLRLSEVQRRLLLYLVEKSLAGEADDLKEYSIGVDAFGKPPSYDPRQESVVRMHVARLRQKLSEYYHTDGAADPIMLDLPKGGFKVVFEARPVTPEVPAAKPLPSTAPARRSYKRVAVIAASCVVLGSATYFALKGRTSDIASRNWPPALQQLWAPLLSPERPLVVCIATPSYGTATGAFRLGQFLGPRKPDLLVTQGTQLSMPDIAMDNVVFLGPVNGLRLSEALPIDEQVRLEPTGIRNLKPKSGEPEFFSDQPPRDGYGVEETHALITLTPGLYGKGEVLYLSGNQVSSVKAAVQAFTDPAVAHSLVEKMKDAAGTMPRYYQLVLKVRAMDDMPIEISYLFHRDLPAKP